MFLDNFESFDWTLTCLRSFLLALPSFPPMAGQVGTGFCPNPFSQLLSDESGKGALFAAQKLFSTILKLGSTANPKLSACGGSNPAEGGTKDCKRKNLDSRSELPFPLSGELLLQCRDQSVLKVFGHGPGNTDTLPQPTSLRGMSIHKNEETPHGLNFSRELLDYFKRDCRKSPILVFFQNSP